MLDINLFRTGQRGRGLPRRQRSLDCKGVMCNAIMQPIFTFSQTREAIRRLCASLNAADTPMWAWWTRCCSTMKSGAKVSDRWCMAGVDGFRCAGCQSSLALAAAPAARYAMEQAKKEFNAINKQIAALKKVSGCHSSTCGGCMRRTLH